MEFDARMLQQVAQSAGVPEADVADAVAAALEAAYNTRPDALPGVTAQVSAATGDVELRDPDGNLVAADGFGVRGAMAARQAIVSWLRDLERRRKAGPWVQSEGTSVRATVKKVLRDGDVHLDVDGITAILPAGEATPGEHLTVGQSVAVLLLAANVTDRDMVRLAVSRRQPALVTALFKQHMTRTNSAATVAAVAREPGVRSKVACAGPEARQAFIGPTGTVVRSVAADLHGEAIDLISYSDDLAAFAASALSPATTLSAELTDSVRRVVRVTVAADQLAIAEGAGGVNLRLACKLTGARIELVTT